MAVKTKNSLLTSINSDLADNNAGAISARDVRQNMVDIVDSIVTVVASGDFEQTPFFGSVKFLGNIITSGIQFPDGLQSGKYPGATNINHNELANLDQGDVHTQYININGARVMSENLGLDDNWINSSGNSSPFSSDDRGFKFEYTENIENIHVGNKSNLLFDVDNSVAKSAKGVAKAYLNFDATTAIPTIKSYYNIHALEKLETGKYKVFFTSGTFLNNNYVALGSSNARSTASSKEDFSINKVGITLREGNDASSLRSLTFVVMEDDQSPGTYTDAKINELVVYGLNPGENSGVHPLVSVPTP